MARLPRTLAGAIVGATLAASGVVLQALLRNPLATPFTLGVSAGAALGSMIAITFGVPFVAAGVTAVPLASLAGALGAVGIVYGLARVRRRGLSTDVLLLAGVTLNALLSSLILFLQYFADAADTWRTMRWLRWGISTSAGMHRSWRRCRWWAPRSCCSRGCRGRSTCCRSGTSTRRRAGST